MTTARELYRTRRRSAPFLLLAVPLLGIARLFPEHGFGLWLRLAAATLLLLLPGRLVARAFGRRGSPAAVTWSVALVAAALAVTFAVHGSLTLTLVLVLAAGAVALPFSFRVAEEPTPRGRGIVALVGIGLGAALWGIEGVVHGDALFHLGRVRKLGDLGSLTLRAVDEFKDGGLHPGYAFPLWHGWLALVAKLAGVDPTSVMLHEPSVLVPIALVVMFETGIVVFRSVWLGVAALVAQVALIGLAPGGGGAYTSLELPGTMSRQLLVPAVIALFFEFVRAPSWQLALTLAAAGMDLAFVHPTYAMFVAIPLVGFAIARALMARTDVRESAEGLAAFSIPVILVFLWLAPIVGETQAHNPPASELVRALQAVRDGSRRARAAQLPPRAGGGRPHRGDRGRGARARAARGLRVPAALERVRHRRDVRRARPRAVVARVPALLRSRLALAVASRGGVRPVRVRAGGRSRRARTRRRAGAAARGARGGDRARAAVPRRLRHEAPPGRPGGRDVDRARRRRSRARRRHAPSPTAASGRSSGRGRSPRRRPRSSSCRWPCTASPTGTRKASGATRTRSRPGW